MTRRVLKILTCQLPQAVGQAGQTDVSVTKTAMEAWIKEALLASDARLVLVAQSVLERSDRTPGKGGGDELLPGL